jgi:hypothetical protein
MMTSVISAATLALSLSCVTAHATDEAAAPSRQLGSCAKAAEGKQGAELKAFMQTCAAAKAPTVEAKARDVKARRTACMEQAQGKSGPEHIQFMANCMKAGTGTAAAPASAASGA